MSTGARTLTVFLAVLTALFVAIAGVCAGWPGPVWVWPVLLLAAPALVVEAVRLVAGRRAPIPPEVTPYLPAAPVERREARVSGVALPSALADYDFFLSGTVRWSPTGAGGTEPLINPAGLAVEAVLARARAITERREPGRASLVQHELNGDLSVMRTEPSGRLRVMAEGITLALADHDRERLEQLAEVRKEKAVWEHRRKHEQSRREYLGEDVFRNTGTALTWWLARNDEQVEKTVEDIGLIARLTSAVNDTDVPERLRHLVPDPDPEPSPFDPPTTSEEERSRQPTQVRSGQARTRVRPDIVDSTSPRTHFGDPGARR
ncbi:hypothetical protein [Streptomyces alkaliphilus]|uniref:hypothetical protein n=1 Tax=Streptomyces alkaliphilus TaxID=1472722 RepID=UPI001567671F|nr:hypothetical protein [Streptomyces alkaliphilus]